MLKKLKKQLDKEIKKQYDKIEKNFMRFQSSSYSDLEERMNRLEEKLDQLNTLIQKDIKAKKDQDSKKDKKKKESKKSSSKESKKKEKSSKEVDFTIITGMGAKIAQFLTDEGISTYKQLATLSNSSLDDLNQKMKGFTARYKRYAWKNQAAELAKQ